MRHRAFIFAIACLSVLALAGEPPTTEQLKKNLETARPEDQAQIAIEIAQRQLIFARGLYTDNKVEEGKAAVEDAVTYADKATDAAIATGKKTKRVEIELREMAHLLRDLQRILAFEDQAPVQAAAEHMEDLRTKLLKHMFERRK